jgi:hypothetical protein
VRVGLLWRREWDPPGADRPRLQGMFDAFSGLGVTAEAVVYSDDDEQAVRAHLLELDGVLVWVNPVEQGRDRSQLDPLLRDVAGAGVWVSAHPDVILRMATKRVLVDTRELGWGTDARLYESADELADALPDRLLAGPVVLKRHRGMGGHGVWKAERADGRVRLEHAGDGAVEELPPDGVRAYFEPCFRDGEPMIEQPFQPRIADGMVRAYLTHDRVVGFARQYPRGLRPSSAGDPPPGKLFLRESEAEYADLRTLLEADWVPGLQRLVGVATHELPVIWDADFLFGFDGRYVLCEINASSTFAFPEHAMPGVARAALAAIG